MRIEIKKPLGRKLMTAGKICDEDIIVVPVLQSKSVTVTENTTVKTDNGYAGMKEVIIKVDVKAPECDRTECEHTELTCDLDFSAAENGDPVDDMLFTAPTGTAYSSVSINKPDTLKPEYIREGIKIAGIVGTFEPVIENIVKYTYAEGVTF